MELNKITSYLDNLLDTYKIEDESYNGLQIEGAKEVKRIAYAVDVSINVIDKCIDQKIDLLIVHHGQFWKSTKPQIIGTHKSRIKKFIENNISLYTSHLPLDLHREVGNNAQLLKLLNCRIINSFGSYKGVTIGFYGKSHKPINLNTLTEKLQKLFNDFKNIKSFSFRNDKIISKIGVVSGRGSSLFQSAINIGIDTFITGEQDHSIYHNAEENQINLIFAGHYNTETLGVKALMQKLNKKYSAIKHIFIEDYTGL